MNVLQDRQAEIVLCSPHMDDSWSPDYKDTWKQLDAAGRSDV